MDKVIARNERVDYTEKAFGWHDAQDTFHRLMDSLSYLVEETDAPKDVKDKAIKDVITDIVIPSLKNMYVDAAEYVLWDKMPSRNRGLNGYAYTPVRRRDYDISEDEKEDSEDE